MTLTKLTKEAIEAHQGLATLYALVDDAIDRCEFMEALSLLQLTYQAQAVVAYGMETVKATTR